MYHAASGTTFEITENNYLLFLYLALKNLVSE